MMATVVLTCAGLLLSARPALATDNDGDIVTTVTLAPTTPLDPVTNLPTITQSTSNVVTYASFHVKLTHYANPETVGPITVKLTTTASAPAAIVGSSLPTSGNATCAAPNSTGMVCTIGTMSNPGETVEFDVTVTAPISGTQLSLNANTSWLEDGDPVPDVDTTTHAASVALASPDPNKLSSFVPVSSASTTLFPSLACVTGPYKGCAATPSQTWTTTVEIPPLSQTTTAQILQSIVPGGCASNMLTCSSSTLTIPGTNFSPQLVITLRRDGSTIKGGNIKHAIILYDAPAHPAPNIVYPLEVPDCTDTTYGTLPQSGIPCIQARTAYAKKTLPNKPPVPAGFEDDWEFVIWAVDNGRFTN